MRMPLALFRLPMLILGGSGAVMGFANSLENSDFQLPPILLGIQTPVHIGEQKRIDPADPNQISGIDGWSHGASVDLGLVSTNKFSSSGFYYQYLYTNNWDRRCLQQTVVPVKPGDSWRFSANAGFALDYLLQPRSAVIELFAGHIDPANPDQLAGGAKLLKSYRIGSQGWGGSVDQTIPDRRIVPIGISWTADEGSLAIGKTLVVSLRTASGSAGPTYWQDAELERIPRPNSGAEVPTVTGNGGLRISMLDPTMPGYSFGTLPAPWDPVNLVRIGDVYRSTWLKVPPYASGNGMLGADPTAYLAYTAQIRNWDGLPKPFAALVTENGTYYATANLVSVSELNFFSVPLVARYWRKNHFLTGAIVHQSQFAEDLRHLDSVHVAASFGGGPTDTSLVRFQIGSGGTSGLTVNCGVLTDGYVGEFNSADGRIAQVELFDQGQRVIMATLNGRAPFYSLSGVLPGTYDSYTTGERFLRHYSGQVTITSSNTLVGSLELVNGDCNDDGYIGTDDYLIISNSFDKAFGDAGFLGLADLTGDQYVNTDDYLILNNNFDRLSD